MSNTAVLNHPIRWVSPLSTPEVIDLDDALVPRCPRTGRTITDREDEMKRRNRHRTGKERKELAMQQRGKPELSEAQDRALFRGSDHPSFDLAKFEGYKLTKRQRAQVKYLKKQRAGKPVELEHHSGRTKSRARLLPTHIRLVASN